MILRLATLASYFGLLGLLVAWFVWLEPSTLVPRSLMLLTLAAPLLLPLRGLLHGRPYTHAWASFLALFYFVVAVFNLAGDLQRMWLGWTALGLSVALFLSCIGYARLAGRHGKPDRQVVG